MDTISYSKAREKLADTMNRVCEDRTPLIITRKGHPSVVVLSLEEWQALEETAHLLRSPRNAKRLTDAIEQLEGQGGTERDLAE